MARLNEPPPPATESIDALKRRFVRQNREIAKANSTQSLRIRNLEGEVSRLLGENVSLREQIIKLHFEVDNNASKPDSNKIDSFRYRLEDKLREVGDLVQELGEAQRDAKRRGQQRRKSMNKASPKRSPNQRAWRNAMALSDLASEADGRLPPILEDQHFPRQTLNSNEIHGLLADPANLTDSPDLGSPPIAHFEEGDPIKFDTRNDASTSKDNFVVPDPPLSANLETRRKRRESSHSRDIPSKGNSTEGNKPSNPLKANNDSSHAFKPGPKRKLNMRDEDEQPSKTNEKDDFQFNRKEATRASTDRSGRVSGQKPSDRRIARTEVNKDTSKDSAVSTTSNVRKALGPKSANSDPQSPAKSSRVGAKDRVPEGRENLAQRMKDGERLRDKVQSKRPREVAKANVDTSNASAPEASVSHEPETPAPPLLDLFSPTSTEPSAARPEGRGDTPPPPDLGPDTGTGSFGRASRRSRGSVSYAEPSLRDKMRRPTKELVDAVGAEERARQARIVESNATNIKKEEEEEVLEPLPNWKTIPVGESQAQKERQKTETASPLGKKAAARTSDLPTSVLTERKRRVSTMAGIDGDNEPLKTSGSGAASTIAALSRPRRQQEPTEDKIAKINETEPHEQKDRTSIFDFTGSSPDPAGQRIEKEEVAGTLSRSSRRHSSVPALSEYSKSSLSITRRPDSRKRERSVGRLDAREAEGRKAAAELVSIQQSVAHLEAGVGEMSLAEGRAERKASRRRSMML